MRFVTASTATGHRLYLELGDRLIDVAAEAGRQGIGGLDSLEDAGDLLRRGPAAQQALRQLTDALGNGSGLAASRSLDELELAPPVLAPGKIVCVGLNYVAHAEEGAAEVPPYPLIFSKYANTLIAHGQSVRYPGITEALDYEGELALVIGRRAKAVSAEEAMGYVGGYTIMNDVSARDLQMGDSQWIRGKSLDTFAPMGPYFLPASQVEDVGSLRIQTRVNGELRQNQPCSDMVFDIPTLIAFISEGITLEPGDVIATGTPSGVGFGFKPPKYLQPGDVVEISITQLGTLRSTVVRS